MRFNVTIHNTRTHEFFARVTVENVQNVQHALAVVGDELCSKAPYDSKCYDQCITFISNNVRLVGDFVMSATKLREVRRPVMTDWTFEWLVAN